VRSEHVQGTVYGTDSGMYDMIGLVNLGRTVKMGVDDVIQCTCGSTLNTRSFTSRLNKEIDHYTGKDTHTETHRKVYTRIDKYR
jgi:hypothetical protein